MARMLPLLGFVPGVGPHQVGLIFLDAHLVDTRHGAPKAHEVVDFAGVALHPDHLHHSLHRRAALFLQPREADKVVAHALEARALAIKLEALFGRAVEAQRDVLERCRQEALGHALVEKGAVGGK